MGLNPQYQSKKFPIGTRSHAVFTFSFLFVQILNGTTALATPVLSHVTALVNGDSRVIPAGEMLDLVAGDKLVLTAAAVSTPDDRKIRASLNFVGFPGKNPERAWDDIGVEINTAFDIVDAHAVNKSGIKSVNKIGEKDSDKPENIFLVRCEVSGRTVGFIHVRIFEPRLKFAEIQINGQSRAMRDGELLSVAGQDQIKLLRFESNIANPANVAFRFQQTSEKVSTPEGMIRPGYEFVFSRSGLPFARIPVRIEAKETTPPN